MTIPPIKEIRKIFFSENRCIQFLIENHILCLQPNCEACGTRTSKCNNSWRCTAKKCRKSKSIFHDSFFAGVKIKANELLYMAYLWLAKSTVSSIILQTGHSSRTVTNYIEHLRQLVGSTLSPIKERIGGHGVIVEMDETKMGKRKYNRGHLVEGVWIFGGIERTPEKKVFLVEVPDRTALTLLKYIKRYVKPGSVIHTDLFKSYSQINSQLGFQHKTVNHSLHYVDPVTKTHTNTIEGFWNGLKLSIKPRNRVKKIKKCLREIIWRRQHKHHLWPAFLDALRSIFYMN